MPIHGLAPVLNVTSITQSFDGFEQLGWQRGFRWNDGGLIGDGWVALYAVNPFGA